MDAHADDLRIQTDENLSQHFYHPQGATVYKC